MTKTQKMILTLKSNLRLTSTLILGIALIGGGFWYAPLAYIGFLLLVNVFDILGYVNVIQQEKYYDLNDPKDLSLPSYRLMQNGFGWLLFFFIFTNFSWVVAVACKLAHWSGLQDVLYYPVAKFKYDDDFTWMYWTPVGIIYYIFMKPLPISKTVIIIQGILGFILGLLLIILI